MGRHWDFGIINMSANFPWGTIPNFLKGLKVFTKVTFGRHFGTLYPSLISFMEFLFFPNISYLKLFYICIKNEAGRN